MTTRKPVIALTPQIHVERDEAFVRPGYFKALRAAGAIPVILPPDADENDLTQLLDLADGILFTGGPDIHPFSFGEETHERCGNVCLRRDRLELALLPLAMAAEKPILGICRGIQLLNIGLGGDIYQDISAQFHEEFPVAHQQPFTYDIPAHTVAIEPGTLLEKTVLDSAYQNSACSSSSGSFVSLRVNSMHHQAVRRLAPGLIASGYAPNGLVEAIEKPDYPTFFLGVQWHPEYLWEQDAAAAGIFSLFVKAAAGERNGHSFPSAPVSPQFLQKLLPDS